MSDEAADGFLSRWSRRKRAAGLVVPEVVVPERPLPDAEAPPAAVPPPAFDPASLPAPETLTAASDITGFLRAEIPVALRRAALRRIWTLDPGIRDFIGPADYAWDYNAPDGVPGFALGLGGDVQKLLAQAMGWQPEAGAAVPEAVSEPMADDVEVPPPAPRSIPAGLVAEAGPAEGPCPLPPALEAESSAPVGAPVGAPAGAPVAARRHGGAMPS